MDKTGGGLRPFIVLLLFLLLVLHLLSSITPTCAAAIHVLAVLPSVWRSHYLYGRRLLERLVLERDATVTLISPHAGETYMHDGNALTANAIREIHVDGLLDNWLEMGMSLNVEQVRHKSVLERFTRLIYAGTTNIDLLLADANVQNMLKSDEKFDLLIADLFLSEAVLGFAYYYQVPTVVVSPTAADIWLDDMMGNPHNSALDASRFLPYTEHMSFTERSINTLMIMFEQLTYNYFHWNSQLAIFEKHFEASPRLANHTMPTYSELAQNLSLAIMNTHPLLHYPRAYMPNMLELAGLHLQSTADTPQQLPNHLRLFIEGAKAGVIYMSLGADVSIVDLLPERLNAFLDVFAQRDNMRVLLKWEPENETAVPLPANVLHSAWLPQEAILAHPNVKVFISAGGVMSVLEAISGLTPMLITPIYAEQITLAERLRQHGVAIVVPFDDITYERIMPAIEQLIADNSTYGQQLLELRKKFEFPHSFDSHTLADRALRYIELVLSIDIGAYLKSPARDIAYLRLALADVVATMLLGLVALMTLAFCVVHKILQWR